MPENYPKRGLGNRNLNCELYGVCLDIATAEGWDSFNCEGCPNYDGKQDDKSTITEKKKPPEICKECGERPTMRDFFPYCSQCMHAKSMAKKQKLAKEKKPPPKISPTLTIEFKGYEDILRQIEGLAKEEIRPIELQAIYMLKRYLNGVQNDLKRD